MRLRQPLNGFKIVKANPSFHLAILIGSFLAVDIKDGNEFKITFHTQDLIADPSKLVLLLRYTHGFMFLA